MSSSKAKKERRLQRHIRNVEKDLTHKKEAWESGKIIYENHNDGYFTINYSLELVDRLYNILKDYISSTFPDQEKFIFKYQSIKQKIIDSILRYNPEAFKTKEYMFLKYSLETYWDNPEIMLENLINYD